MGFKMINECFTCEHCKAENPKHPGGSARNHCRICLYSMHLDEEFPGDRMSDCGGLMAPVDLDHKRQKGYMLRHRCLKCGKEGLNKVAEDDEILGYMKERNKKLQRYDTGNFR